MEISSYIIKTNKIHIHIKYINYKAKYKVEQNLEKMKYKISQNENEFLEYLDNIKKKPINIIFTKTLLNIIFQLIVFKILII